GVVVHLAYPVAVVVPRPLPVPRRVPAGVPLPVYPVVPRPLVGVQHAPLDRLLVHQLLEFGCRGRAEHLQPRLTGLAPDHRGHRRPVGAEGAVAGTLVSTALSVEHGTTFSDAFPVIEFVPGLFEEPVTDAAMDLG